jgi:aminopeptidase N
VQAVSIAIQYPQERTVPAENLTRIEARERAALLNVHEYQVTLDLRGDGDTFLSKTVVRFSAARGTSTFIDAITRSVRRVNLNGKELDPGMVSDGVRIQLSRLAEENELIVEAEAEYTNTGEGLHRFIDPVDGETYLYTQFEVPDSRRVFAVFEQPDLKATFQFTVTAPKDWQVVSNQRTPSPILNDDGSATWKFEPTQIMSSYITALIAGPYSVVRSELTSRDGRTIPLGIFTRASLAEFLDAEYIFEKTRQGFAFFESQFDYAYPFEKYDQLFVPEFNAGAMENAGAVTFTEAYVFRSKVSDAMRERRVVTILHELAHMWFGDLVTMRWWNDLWLNESFAEYMSTLATAEATEWDDAWTTFAVMEKSWAYRQDQLPSTHPIVAEIRDLEDVQVNFDGITYAKGASVLKQLVAWVGQEAFMRGVHQYFVKHAFANTELPDLLNELEHESGRDLTIWSELWLETAGVNTLRPVFTVNDAGQFESFIIEQTAPADYPTIRPHRLAIGLYELRDGKLVRVRRFEVDIDGSQTPIDELVGVDCPELVLINDDDLTYAKIRLDNRSRLAAFALLSSLDDALARALIWGSFWDATRDAEIPAQEFIDLVLAHIETETSSTTIRTVLNQLALASSQFVDPARRQATREHVASALWQLAQQAIAGSDAQFQFLRAFTQLASNPEQLSIVRDLFSGQMTLPGLDIDTDLGWDLLISMCAGGVASASEIDEYLATDTTATGQQSAAHARAARPTPDAKHEAWASVTAGQDASNLIVRSTGLGFLQVHEPALLEAFIEPYFDGLLEIWNSRSYAMASEIIDGFFPAPLANKRLRDAALAWLSDHAEPAALRRLVIENLAGVERALAAQAVDTNGGS